MANQDLVNTLTELNDTLKKSIKTNRESKTGTLAAMNNRSLNEISNRLLSFGNAIGRLDQSFGKAEKLQKSALSIGTSLSKFTSENNTQLKKLRGSFFDNAQELLDNYAEGIRENSEGLNTLQNRMKITGQSTDSVRKAMSFLTTVTGGSIEAVDRLSKQNIQLAEEYKVSNESLIDAILSLKDVLKKESLYGSSEKIASVIAEAAALGGPKLADSLKSVIPYLLSSESFGLKSITGTTAIEKILRDPSINPRETLSRVLDATNKIAEFGDRIVSRSKGAASLSQVAEPQFKAFFGSESMAADIKTVATTLEYQLKIAGDQRKLDAEMQITADTLAKEAHNFYEETLNHFYPTMLTMAAGLAGVGSVVGTLATFGVALKSITRLAGPLGILAGIVAYNIPDLLKMLDNSTSEANKTQEEMASDLKKIREKVVTAETGKPARESLLDSLGREVSRAMMQNSSRDKYVIDPELKNTLDNLTEVLKKIRTPPPFER